jgi:hypothetical protein
MENKMQSKFLKAVMPAVAVAGLLLVPPLAQGARLITNSNQAVLQNGTSWTLEDHLNIQHAVSGIGSPVDCPEKYTFTTTKNENEGEESVSTLTNYYNWSNESEELKFHCNEWIGGVHYEFFPLSTVVHPLQMTFKENEEGSADLHLAYTNGSPPVFRLRMIRTLSGYPPYAVSSCDYAGEVLGNVAAYPEPFDLESMEINNELELLGAKEATPCFPNEGSTIMQQSGMTFARPSFGELGLMP